MEFSKEEWTNFYNQKNARKPNHIVDTFSRAKVAFKYLSEIAFGNADEKINKKEARAGYRICQKTEQKL